MSRNRFFNCLLLCFVLICQIQAVVWADDTTDTSQPAAADSAEDAKYTGDLSRLENKLYQHDFATESVQTRLDRVERLIYGSAKSGSTDERMNELLKDVHMLPPQQAAAPPVSSAAPSYPQAEAAPAYPQPEASPAYSQAQTQSAYPPAYPQAQAQTAYPPAYPQAQTQAAYPPAYPQSETQGGYPPQQTADASPQIGSQYYPQVGDPLGVTTPAYPQSYQQAGSSFPQGGSGYSQAGSGYSQAGSYPQNGANYQQSGTAPQTGSATAYQKKDESKKEKAIKGPQASHSLKGEVTAMETQVFGQNYEKDTLTNRVTRLEQTVFAQQPVQHFNSLPKRVDNLMAALQPQFGQPQNLYSGTPYLASSKESNKSDEEKHQQGHPFLKKLGSTLGRAAMVVGPMAGSMAASSMMYGGGMGGFGGMGGYGGYGGYGGMGNMGGMNINGFRF